MKRKRGSKMQKQKFQNEKEKEEKWKKESVQFAVLYIYNETVIDERE